MGRHPIRLVAVLAAVVLAVGIGFLASRPIEQGAAQVDSPLVGKPAPAVAGETLGGHRRVAIASLKGEVVVLSFFASWCGPCGAEAPNFAAYAFHVRRSHAPVRILGVVYNDQDSAAVAFAAKYGLTFPVLEDPDGTIANAFGVDGPPVTVVVDAAGRVSAVLDGPVTEPQLAAAAGRAVRA